MFNNIQFELLWSWDQLTAAWTMFTQNMLSLCILHIMYEDNLQVSVWCKQFGLFFETISISEWQQQITLLELD